MMKMIDHRLLAVSNYFYYYYYFKFYGNDWSVNELMIEVIW